VRGFALAPPRPYLAGRMNLFKNMAPLKAVRDLRVYMANRKPYELWFLVLALAITIAIWFGFLHDSQFEKPYKPNIIYVENWPITRSDKEIIDQQKRDKIKRDAERAEIEKKQKARQEEFKQIDNALKSVGI
jgi:hypothetical protein